MGRPLKWWCMGWYSIKDWRYHLWIQDDFGNAVFIERNTLTYFTDLWWW